MDCFDSAANACVMWQAIPVPWFGKIEAAQIATVGLNPSWTEFVTKELVWRNTGERLPVVMDAGVEKRGEITGVQAQRMTEARKNYFATDEREPHPWFKVLQGVINAAKMNCAYVTGTAVHLDLVACATWREWGKLDGEAKTSLINKCFPKFTATLKQLPPNARLLLDGRTVFETVTTRCDAVVESAKVVGENPGLEVWRGKLSVSFGRREFLAWSNPVNRQKNQQPLVAWLRRQAQ
ncbi:MAG TPA: hypothetical protein PKA41_20230 [Verrucomicrobiota bacterium]|nr:hypothetical protein [Verrucomicrobiota bacterium]